MPPKKNLTPIKPSEVSTMTHDYEEMRHAISKLQEKMHQISLSQRETQNKMDGMEDGMEAKMDDMEAKINKKMKYNM